MMGFIIVMIVIFAILLELIDRAPELPPEDHD